MEVEYGFCHCGCGGKTKLAKKSHKRSGHIKGEPVRFIKGHHGIGSNGSNWNGGKSKSGGYQLIKTPGHYRTDKRGYVPEHILIVEKVLKKNLPPCSEIHHVDGNKFNNSNSNLVVCQDRSYHMLLHMRARALRACGNVNWRKCPFCKKYDDLKNLYITPPTKTLPSGAVRHRECFNEYCRINYKHK